jgi:ribosomal protein L4
MAEKEYEELKKLGFVPRDNRPTEEEIKELKKLGFVPRDNRALFRPKKSASEDAKKSAKNLKQFHSTTGMSCVVKTLRKRPKAVRYLERNGFNQQSKNPALYEAPLV